MLIGWLGRFICFQGKYIHGLDLKMKPRILLWDLGSMRDELNEPLGIEILAGTVSARYPEIEVELKWNKAGDDTLSINETESFDIIGLSVNLGAFDTLQLVINDIQKASKQPLIVLGGLVPTFAYNELIHSWQRSICVLGEGEDSFLRIISLFYLHGVDLFKGLDTVPNIAYKLSNDILCTKREPLTLVDPFHPIRKYIDFIIKQGGIARIEASRGCPWSKCEFCCIGPKYGGGGWRPMPITFILEELKRLSASGILSPYFTDEDFIGGQYERSNELATAIIDLKNQFVIPSQMNYFASLRVNDVISSQGQESLKIWKTAGLREVFIGLESGVKEQLHRYGKASTPNVNKKAIEILHNLGYQIDIGFIFFDPEMTFEELCLNTDFLNRLKLNEFDSRSIKPLRVQPNTKIFERYLKAGLIKGPLVVNDLIYPAQYIDERVFAVFENFKKWENEFINETYKIQSKSRGEIKEEALRYELKRQLSEMRNIDLLMLRLIISKVSDELSKDVFQCEEGKLRHYKINVLSKANEILLRQKRTGTR